MSESESRGHIYNLAIGGGPADSELPEDQQWFWVGRDRRVSVRLTASLWAEIERRAAALNLPWSAVLRHVLTRGLSVEERNEP